MSTRTLYEQTETQLYSWLEEVFETPKKIIVTITWRPNSNEHTLYIGGYSKDHLIQAFEMGNRAEKVLEKYKLDVLGEYATNPGICGINLDKLTNEQKLFLKEELERRHKPLKEKIAPYEDLLDKLQ